MLRYSDIPKIKEHINIKAQRIAELEKLDPTPERLAEVMRIEKEAKILARTIKELRGKSNALYVA